MKSMHATLVFALALGVMTAAQTDKTPGVNQPNQSAFKGCLQGDTAKGFSLLAATGDGSGGDTKGQTMTYKVVAAGKDVDLSRLANKVVEISGTLSTSKQDTGQMPAPVTDSVRGTAGAGGTGKPGENTAFYYANGTLTAKSIREVAGTCATRSAPDNDKK